MQTSPLLLSLLLCLPLLTLHAVADLDADSRGLLGFLHGLGASHRVKNWSNTTSPCASWIGVTCNVAQDSVLMLNLPGKGLYGTILPGTLGLLSQLQVLSLRSNFLTGPLPADLANCTQLRRLFLQKNRFNGTILPFEGTVNPGLATIDLSFNQFQGGIPTSFATLSGLKRLLLQNNSLTGTIPANLDKSGTLVELNLANNNLSGSIPVALRNFNASSFSGNADLCGHPLLSACLVPTPSPSPAVSIVIQPPTSRKSKKLSTLAIVLIVVGGAALLLLIGACCLLCYLRSHSSKATAGEKPAKPSRAFVKTVDDFKDEYSSAQQPEHNKLVFFQGATNAFDLEDLLRASAEVLGKGSFGTSYKAVLEDGSTVVVKRLKEVSVGRKDFEQQMDVVGRLRHRNLVPMRAYYYSKEEKLLVHEYLFHGNLATALHGTKTSAEPSLDWDCRLRVAVAVARGVAHLHGTGSKFTHGDIKSSNVLIHREYDACVADYGLTSLFSPNDATSRTIGYRAPEVAETRKVTQKSDVYSFGVLLLEILTAKAPSQISAEEGMDLPRWVQSVVREEWTSEVFDVELMRFQNIEEELVQLLQIALTCVSTAPDQRPKMTDVLKMIEDVRPVETDEGNTQSSSAEEKSNESAGEAAPTQMPAQSEQKQESSATMGSSTDQST